jgi:aerobic carbon-monoxide dehydrogenase medium subunit
VKLPRFTYIEAQSLAEACTLLAERPRDTKLVAGGTDVLVKMKHRRLTPSTLVSMKGIAELDHIRYEPGTGLSIGPLVTIEAVKCSSVVRDRYPVLQQAAGYMATVVIRNRATVAGNICNGSPSAEMAPGLIVLGAEVLVVGPAGGRSVAIEDFFTGPGSTVLGPGEIVAEIRVPEPPPASVAVYEKHSLRRMDVAMVGVAAAVVPAGELCADIKIALSAVAPTPIRALKAEALLRGYVPTAALVAAAANAAAEESRPITDIRGSAAARRAITEALTGQVVHQALKATKLGVV